MIAIVRRCGGLCHASAALLVPPRDPGEVTSCSLRYDMTCGETPCGTAWRLGSW